MSPKSIKEPPRYTDEKLDVFSQGVIVIQVCTRQFPDPGPAVKGLRDAQSPTGSIQVPVLEPVHRKKHIAFTDPTHPLLPIAMACLEYRERERETGHQLRSSVRGYIPALKEYPKYIESSQNTANIYSRFRSKQNITARMR